MQAEIKLFSHLKYRFGIENLVVDVQNRITALELKLKINKIGGSRISEIPFRIAVNGRFVEDDYIIQGEDELALIPPVQGG